MECHQILVKDQEMRKDRNDININYNINIMKYF